MNCYHQYEYIANGYHPVINIKSKLQKKYQEYIVSADKDNLNFCNAEINHPVRGHHIAHASSIRELRMFINVFVEHGVKWSR